MYCVDSSLSGGCLMGCVLCLGLLWMGCCDHLFCSGWVVCINRAEFSGVVWIVGWSVLVGLGLL